MLRASKAMRVGGLVLNSEERQQLVEMGSEDFQ